MGTWRFPEEDGKAIEQFRLFLFPNMNKKVYRKPFFKVVPTDAFLILAGSTGATGEDVPWASSKQAQQLFDDAMSEELENE